MIRPNPSQRWRHRADSGRIRAQIGAHLDRFRPNLGQARPNTTNINPNRGGVASKFGPTSAKAGRTPTVFAGFGPYSADFSPSLAGFGRTRPSLGQFWPRGQSSPRIGQIIGRVRPQAGLRSLRRRRPHSAGVCAVAEDAPLAPRRGRVLLSSFVVSCLALRFREAVFPSGG